MDSSTIIIVAVALILVGVVRRFLTGSARPVPAEDVQALVNNGAVVVDVRSPEEFARHHFEGARNIPVSEIAKRADEIGNRQEPVVLYCASGSRSGLAVAQLRRLGFEMPVNGGSLGRMQSIRRR